MRINAFIATATGLSRRAVDTLIAQGKVRVNSSPASLGQQVSEADVIELNRQQLDNSTTIGQSKTMTVMLNKPAGYVVSRNGQGNRTIYELLPARHHHLKPIGRLDKDSSGLLLLTNDGQLAYRLTHPSQEKIKVYHIMLNKPLEPAHQDMVDTVGIQLEDGKSQLRLQELEDRMHWQVTMHEGRNRQIRRTFETLGYDVAELQRVQFGTYELRDIPKGKWLEL